MVGPFLVYQYDMQGGIAASGASVTTTVTSTAPEAVDVLIAFCDRWGLSTLDYIAYTLPDTQQLQEDLAVWSEPNDEDRQAVSEWLHALLAGEGELWRQLAAQSETVRILTYDHYEPELCTDEGTARGTACFVGGSPAHHWTVWLLEVSIDGSGIVVGTGWVTV